MAGVLKLLRLRGYPILAQLQLEEALLRTSTANWCITNDGAAETAIVMGISGRAEELVEVTAAAAARVQLVKRFTGGGTVIVDSNTLFATLIMQQDALPGVEPFPQPIMRWTEGLYMPVFGSAGPFALRENDYVFQHKKFGGNAQAITRGRWLHHTSFLWDYCPGNMALLKQPARAPEYRKARSHEDFLVKLRDLLPQRSAILDAIPVAAAAQGLVVQEATLAEAAEHLALPHLRGNKLLPLALEGDSAA